MTQGSRGTTIGGFTLTHRLKIGGSSEVFAAEGPDGTPVALKRLLPEALEEFDGPLMFQAEARVASRLNHPRIARLVEDGTADLTRGEAPYLVYELVDGVDLASLRRRFVSIGQRPDALGVAALAWQAADALAYVHSEDIVHRDISPHNLMLGRSGRLKLIDFGIAKYADNPCQTGVGIIKGKHAYMSPEQVDEALLAGTSDVFSLGVTLYELASCTRLFRANTPLEALRKIREASVPPLRDIAPEVPPWLDEIIAACLRRDASARLDARDLGDLLEERLARAHAQPEQSCAAMLAVAYGGSPPSPTDGAFSITSYRDNLHSAELAGEETTDQLEHSNATRFGAS